MSYKVLIVDDSKLARMSIAKLLGALHPDWDRGPEADWDPDRSRALGPNSS